MHRCFVDQNAWQEPEVQLSVEESHHLLRVLRARPGDPVEIFDGRGRVAGAKLISGRGKIARAAILPDSIRMVAPDPVSITLVQAVPKHGGLEEIIQKAVELGVQKIVPVITERVVVKFKDGNINPNVARRSTSTLNSQVDRELRARSENQQFNPHMERWRKIALAAAKQCQAAWLTEISAVAPLPEAVNAAPADLRLFGSLAPGTPSLKSVLGTISRSTVKSVALAIGPEGDFTEGERELLGAAGFTPVSFGSRVLRVATAALFGLSALNYEFRETKAEGT